MEEKKEENLNSTLKEAIRLFELGLTYIKLHDYDEALDYFQKSLKIAIELNDNQLIDKIIANIGNSYDAIATKQLDILEYRLNIINIMQKTLPDTPATSIQIARILNNIGDEYLKEGQYNQSLDYFLKSLETIKDKAPKDHPYLPVISTNIVMLCETLNNEGNTCLTLEQYDQALEYFNKSFITLSKIFPQGHKDLAIIYSNIIKTCAVLHGIGKQYLQENKQKEALDIFIKISDAVLQHLIKDPAIDLLDSKSK